MNNNLLENVQPDIYEIEAERYELFEKPLYRFELDRRSFLKTLGGGLLVVSLLQLDSDALEERREIPGGQQDPEQIGAWIHIDENGTVTAYSGKAEVGQNIRTALIQAVAEELPAPLESIRMVMSDTAIVPYDRGTFGSQSTPRMVPQARRAAAAAREMLLDAAAEQLKAERTSLSIENGKVTHISSNRSLTFGEITKGQEIMKVISGEPNVTPVDEWKVLGKSLPKADGRDFVTGRHQYTSDIRLPGMLYAKVLRPPAYDAKLTSFNATEAEAMPDTVVVHDGDFIGVAAPDEFAATNAVKAIQTEWKTVSHPSSDELFTHLKETSSESGGRGGGRGRSGGSQGSVEDGLKESDHVLEDTYTIAYIAHTPLEPRAAVADWKDGNLTVWTGTQRPFGVQSELARAFSMPEEKVRVIVPDTGSGYGGKHSGEAAIEAARIAKEAGKPVKLVWTREEEMTWAYFRPAGVIDVRAGVTKDGLIKAWEFHNYNSGGSSINPLYEIPNQQVQTHNSNSPLRQGSYRALAATANHFARESFIDDLAHAVKMDPLAFRLKNLQHERFIGVLKAAADHFGWGKEQSTPNRGFGIAGGTEKGSYIATCAEVVIDGRDVRVVRAVAAFDCGPALNPDHLKNQIEGMVVMGLGGALFEAIEFADGKIKNPRLSQYRVPRFRDIPKIECVLVERNDVSPSGAGETPIVGIAPAVGNAIFAATGIRLRSLPMVPNGLKV